jgi:hypothetical protein
MTTMPTIPGQTADDQLLAELTTRMERRERWARRVDTALEWIGGTIYLIVMLLIWGAMVGAFAFLIRWVMP